MICGDNAGMFKSMLGYTKQLCVLTEALADSWTRECLQLQPKFGYWYVMTDTVQAARPLTSRNAAPECP